MVQMKEKLVMLLLMVVVIVAGANSAVFMLASEGVTISPKLFVGLGIINAIFAILSLMMAIVWALP